MSAFFDISRYYKVLVCHPFEFDPVLRSFPHQIKVVFSKSQIARELEVDRRTVDKYINGYQKPVTRRSTDCITPFYEVIKELLSDRNQQVFYEKNIKYF